MHYYLQAFDYYQNDAAVIPETPIFNIQAGANGELYAEPDPSMSFHPSQVDRMPSKHGFRIIISRILIVLIWMQAILLTILCMMIR